MRIPDSLVEKLLKDSGKFSVETLADLRTQELSQKKPLQDLVLEHKLLTEEDLTRLYADEIGIPFIEFNNHQIGAESVAAMPERVARNYRAVVFRIDGDGTKYLAINEPNDVAALTFLRKQLGGNVKLHIATHRALEGLLDTHYRSSAHSVSQIHAVENNHTSPSIDDTVLVEGSSVAETAKQIIEQAISTGASDIHIEPRESFVSVRYRIDGVLRNVYKLPRARLVPLIDRIKIISSMNLHERYVPQVGRFEAQVGPQRYRFRVSTLPIVDGEKVVIRIAPLSEQTYDLRKLGFWGQALAEIHHAVVQPHGMVVVSGPTLSGKSTTMFSIVQSLNSPALNIATVEDPIEVHLAGVNQTQVDAANQLSVKGALNAVLEQDPNVVLLGLMPSSEVAEVAFRAAQSRCLVLSSLPAKSASASFDFFKGLGIPTYLSASAVRLVINQRLVRKLCVTCRQSYAPNKTQLVHLTKEFELEKPHAFKELHELEKTAIVEKMGVSVPDEAEASTTPTGIKRLWNANPEGCAVCNHTGYSGRISIAEVLTMSEKLQKTLASDASSIKIEASAVNETMIPLGHDGLVKALRGQTTIDELNRVLLH